MRVQVTLKSGAQIEFEADKIRTHYLPDGTLTGIVWRDAANPLAPQLMNVDTTQIDAIVTQATEGEPS